MLLQVVCHKNEDVASPGLEMASSGKQTLLGWGLKLQVERPGEGMPLGVKLPHLISDALGSTAPCTGKLQTRRAALSGSQPWGATAFILQSCRFGVRQHTAMLKFGT